MEGSIYVRKKFCYLPKASYVIFRRQHMWCIEDATVEQVKLVDCFNF